DHCVGMSAADKLVDLPEACAPDLAVVMHFVVDVFGIVLGCVHPAEERRVTGVVSDRVPRHHIDIPGRRLRSANSRMVGTRPVVSKTLPHGAALGRLAPPWNLVVLYTVAKFVEDDVRIFRI